MSHRRTWIVIGLLAAIVALPISLRRDTATASARKADDRLVVITPHNESIRAEFGEAFAGWWRERTGRTIHIDWRTPGGTSEIRMVLDAGFKAAEETGNAGIGMDVFFGGGEPDFAGQAKKGRFVPLRVFDTHPEWFAEGGPIPAGFTGERYRDEARTWTGVCISQFGICFNPAFVARLGLAAPAVWSDLGDPRYLGTLALADPTKSGSVARTFELLVQGEMQRALRERPDQRDAALADGWARGLQLIQRMAANARYFTDSASKIPHDVGQGNAAAGMCIDFYGRSYAHDLVGRDGEPRVVWIAPEGGTTLSADPIAVLKGAPNPEVAQSFVEFCLAPESQLLWFTRPGMPHGPVARALHRTPIRRDVYTPERLAASTLTGVRPYDDPGNFTYDQKLTGRAFNTLRQLVKVMCIDSHEEMKEAWRALRDAGMPADALAVFSDVSIMPYATGGQGDPRFDGSDALRTAENAARIGEWFRDNYRRARDMARASAARGNTP
jgi:ABC-type Fe3+ transport system substrate-binding protein